MPLKCFIGFIMFFLLCTSVAEAIQTIPFKKTDTTKTGKLLDSATVYKKIQAYAEKRKITYWLYKNIFREVSNPVINVDNSTKAVAVKHDTYEEHRGKIIRKITVLSRDPFGTSVNDTVERPQRKLEKAANVVHLRSLPFTIRNQLLFKKKKPLDPLLIYESERLLRQAPYINDAKILVFPACVNCDTVDVTVIVRDKWTLYVSVNGGTTSGNASIGEDNVLGLGQQIRETYNYKVADPYNGYTVGKYSIPNIKNTFIGVQGYYSTDPIVQSYGISVGRGFYSAITKWAGNLDLVEYSQPLSIIDPVTLATGTTTLKYFTKDVWLGRSISAGSRTNADRSSALIIAVRAFDKTFIQKPDETLYPAVSFNNSTLYLASIGVSSRHYYRDRNIYRFGATEDVPEGRLLNFVTGIENRYGLNTQYYAGVRFAFGNHIYRGYWAGAVEYGSYYNGLTNENGAVNAGVTWFSDLLYWNRWGFRPFVYLNNIFGVNRTNSESLNLNGSNGLLGFNSTVTGRSKIALNLQLLAYLPYNFIGFRFAPLLFAGFGAIGTPVNTLDKSRLYQLYGIGLLIRNENLVTRTFQFSFAFYPGVSQTDSPFVYDPVGSFNLGLRDYFVSKPDLVSYR